MRKIRWGGKGQGKRGGNRIIYYWKTQKKEIWLLTIYSKKEQDNISQHVLRLLKQELQDHE
ncbi:MAG: type II toxin-antitoxin system RelE/ParE family toxin [Legionellales bacterium]|nr:type II toxin-antitoxin system RelE/ParE family toxin [Legionellales bacterium]